MNHSLIIFGIQATLRAAQAGADLYSEHSRDRKVFLPDLELPEDSKFNQLRIFLKEHPDLIDSNTTFADIWNPEKKRPNTTDPQKIDPAYAIMLEFKADDLLKKNGKSEIQRKHEAKMLAAGSMVEQWRKDRKPPNALVRMALTLTDIGLEFVGANPSILGVSSRGEKLISAFALNMSELIPNNVAEFGPEADFADRVLGIFMRAGLGSLCSNSSIVFSDEDIANLFSGVAKPIVDALPDKLNQQIDYRDLVDALAGPAAEAAFKILSENTETYLGKDFSSDKALGAVTSALFNVIRDTANTTESIKDVFSEQGAIRIYQACLEVAVKRPELFIEEDKDTKAELLQGLLSGTAATLSQYPRFKGPLGASLLAMAIEVVGNNAPALLKLDSEEPWENVAKGCIQQISTTLAGALKPDENGSVKGALKVFSNEQLLELGRVILTQAAKTPGMMGVDRTEVQAIIESVAAAMAADDNLLLSSDEWIIIAGIAAQKAAANPGRLFGLSIEDNSGALAETVIKSVLDVAGKTWISHGRSEKSILVGQTLVSAFEILFDALAGNISAVIQQPELIDQFLNLVLATASANPEKFGSDGVLKIIRTFIGTVISKGTLPTEHEIMETLSA
ncbi:MAG: hypothetical protein K8S13_24435 [Desulfobacula sp.]|uniref:hypothetical protein n=1 Tax=Desulfobacula sp. TaxID=2593537 RepID=UPI0025B9D467|nr:hypothetical protein [Desulfobacula sp.]MCD4722978.1 hypothetical protein [Desulfobacula sp.]